MKIPYFDAHCDTIGMALDGDSSLRRNGGHVDLERGAALGRYAQVYALFADAQEIPRGEMWPVCRRLYRRFLNEVAANSDMLTACRNSRQIDAAVDAGKMAALLSIECADLLDCRVDRIETVAQWGVRMMNLTWNHPNAISGANGRDAERGLSARGIDFVRELECNCIYADVSHLSDTGFWDLMRISRRPVVASHSNARTLCAHSRNLTDDMFRAIRDSGGIVGLNFYRNFVGGSGDIHALIAHMEHFLNLNGEKTVCFGGDMDGCDLLVKGIDGLQSIPELYERLRQRGYGESLLEDLFWNNLKRIF